MRFLNFNSLVYRIRFNDSHFNFDFISCFSFTSCWGNIKWFVKRLLIIVQDHWLRIFWAISSFSRMRSSKFDLFDSWNRLCWSKWNGNLMDIVSKGKELLNLIRATEIFRISSEEVFLDLDKPILESWLGKSNCIISFSPTDLDIKGITNCEWFRNTTGLGNAPFLLLRTNNGSNLVWFSLHGSSALYSGKSTRSFLWWWINWVLEGVHSVDQSMENDQEGSQQDDSESDLNVKQIDINISSRFKLINDIVHCKDWESKSEEQSEASHLIINEINSCNKKFLEILLRWVNINASENIDFVSSILNSPSLSIEILWTSFMFLTLWERLLPVFSKRLL